jgi:hypothetical protein
MDQAVGLRISYHFGHHGKKKDRYEIIVKNVAYEKKVSLWVEKKDCWGDIFAEYKESMPGGFEKWIVETNEKFSKFAVKYQVDGRSYWDNNGGNDYRIPKYCDDFFVLTGCEFPIVLGESLYAHHTLYVYSAVQNLSIHKKVGIVYTTDNWKKCQNIFANHFWTMESGVEVWKFDQHIAPLNDIEFALFCTMNGVDYWDNNFYRNYIEKTGHISIMAATESPRSELWEMISSQKEISEISEKKEIKVKEFMPLAEPILTKAD